MAAPLGRDTLPEHWSYGVCKDGRVFFVKWVKYICVAETNRQAAACLPSTEVYLSSFCSVTGVFLSLSAMKRTPLLGSIPEQPNLSIPDTWYAQVRIFVSDYFRQTAIDLLEEIRVLYVVRHISFNRKTFKTPFTRSLQTCLGDGKKVLRMKVQATS